MVKVIGVEVRKNSQGEEFTSLTVMGGLEMVKSEKTGKFYATARKCSIPSTFDRTTAKSFIGSNMPGTVEKVECEPYPFTMKGGEVIQLSHTYAYNPTPATTEEVVMGEHAMA